MIFPVPGGSLAGKYVVNENSIPYPAWLQCSKFFPGSLECANLLHLNKAKGLWTWPADIYAVALFLLALTGMLMIRGKGKWRGVILTGIGTVGPILSLMA